MSQSGRKGGAGARESRTVTHGFQQQDPSQGFSFPKSEPSPQHGQKPNKAKAQPVRAPRSFEPKPGH
jgi:hypothetical protein